MGLAVSWLTASGEASTNIHALRTVLGKMTASPANAQMKDFLKSAADVLPPPTPLPELDALPRPVPPVPELATAPPEAAV
eukprot:1650133-Alexandrium_andersonii.AAC.1